MKKKGLLVGICGMVLAALAGCGAADTRQEFNEAMDAVSKGDANQVTYRFWLDELELADSDAYTHMIVTQLKDMNVSGTIKVDETTEAVAADFEVEVLGETIPVALIMSEAGYDISMDLVSSVQQLSTAFGEAASLDEALMSSFQDKFFRLNEEVLEEQLTTYDELAFPAFDFEAYRPTASGVKWSDSINADFINTLDKVTFVKEGDVISHTFTMSEIQAAAAYYKEHAKDQEQGAQLAEVLEQTEAEVTDFSCDVEVDTKKQQLTLYFTMTMKEVADKVSFGMQLQPEKTEVSVTVPEKEQLITTAELEELFIDKTTAADMDSEGFTFSDEDFEYFYTGIVEMMELGFMEEDEILEYVAEYQDYLTEYQLEQVNEVLN